MGNYAVPESIRKLKPKGTMVKKIKGGYYVYTYKSERERFEEGGRTCWKTKTIMGSCIGTITEKDGFVPNAGHLAKDSVTSRNYGNYAVAMKCASDTYERLLAVFHPDDAKQIFSAALIFFCEGFTYMTAMKDSFELSYLPLVYRKVHLGYDAVHKLYMNLGTKQTRVREFESMLIGGSSRKIAVDGHVIACSSERNALSEFEYKASKLGTRQINWLTAYDVADGCPLLSHVSSGADPDRVPLQSLFGKYSFSNTEFLVDRGFNTAPDKELMSRNGNTYIVPMISGRRDYKSVMDILKFDKRRYFVFSTGGHASVIYYSEYRASDDSCLYIAYQDTTRAAAEREEYVKAMSLGKSGYTQEGLLESEPYFGLFLLETNAFSLTAETIFRNYKSRWRIETYYNYVCNSVDFNALYQQDCFCMQGVSFIVNVTGMIYHDVRKTAESANVSVTEIMNQMKKLKITLEGDKWVVQNKIKCVRQLADKIGFDIPKYISA